MNGVVMEETLLFATSNKNKLREFQQMLGNRVVQVDVVLVEPQAIEVEDVVREKALQAYRILNKPVLVEDTGLFFHAWNGFPGALVKWMLTSVGLSGMLDMLGPQADRSATAKTSIGFYDGKEVRLFSGSIEGAIARTVRGESGFGWDPIFIPNGFKKSFAELSEEQKNLISMRSIALSKLRKFMA